MRRCKLLTHEKSTKLQQKPTNERNNNNKKHIGLGTHEHTLKTLYEEIENVFVSFQWESEKGMKKIYGCDKQTCAYVWCISKYFIQQ